MLFSLLTRFSFHIFTVCFLLIPIACNGGQMGDKFMMGKYEKLTDVPASVWKKVSSKKIFFGHQSVGYNILEGVQEITSEHPAIKMAIEETFDPDTFDSGSISHFKIGHNENPRSKLDMFSSFAKSGGAEKADILFLKFCYIDFNSGTDIHLLFESYRATFTELKSKYPHTIFIHCTVPLTTIQTGPKAMIKKLIGRPVGGIAENIKRHDFNELLRKNYEGKEPVFDIAVAESTFPDGNRATYEHNGSAYYYLVPAYTSDGGHLNELGRKVIATKLLLLFASISP